MTTQRATSIFSALALALFLLPACGTGTSGAPNTTQAAVTPTAAATDVSHAPATVSAPDLSKCADEYSRPPSSSSFVPEGARLDPNTVYTPTINITRGDYEAALAKWNAQGISEYEIAVNNVALGGQGTILRVTSDKVQVLGYFYSDDSPIVQSTPETTEPSKYDLENTVAGLFEHVDGILNFGVCPNIGEMAFPVEYEIEFDQALGYPARIERNGYAPIEWHEQGIFSTLPAHSSYWKSVRKFTVLSRGEPGMPKSGQPNR